MSVESKELPTHLEGSEQQGTSNYLVKSSTSKISR